MEDRGRVDVVCGPERPRQVRLIAGTRADVLQNASDVEALVDFTQAGAPRDV